MSVVEEAGRVAFGRFEADLQSGELWRGSLRVRLPAQPFKVLAALLEKPGEVISREDLQERLWGKETNVDFERAIAGAINKVREALGDSAENPKYVETLPKRGYRFVAVVTTITRHPRVPPQRSDTDSPPPPLSLAIAPSHALPIAEIPPAPSAFVEDKSGSVARSNPPGNYPALALGAMAVILAILLAWSLAWRTPPPIPEVDQLTIENPISEGPPNEENLPILATDGASIFATALVEGRPQLAAISIGTGDIQPVPLPQELASVSIADLSSDGTRLLLLGRTNSAAEQPLWVVPTTGGRAFRIGNIAAHAAAWMPDGASILYASGNDLSVVRLADGYSVHVINLPARAFWPRWSPDGKLLRFTMMDPMKHSSTIWEMKAGASQANPVAGLGDNGSQVCCGIWTADGSSYIFQMYRERERERGSDLWELSRPFGIAKLRRLTQGPFQYYFSPIAARSERKIFLLGSDNPVGLQRFDPATHEFLSEKPFLRNATRVEYSPDGASLVWTDPGGGLWRARAADGSDRLQLVPPQYEVFAARWSPDGTRLALMAREPGHPWTIYVESATGGELTPMLDETHNAADPSWSPDGQQLVFGREPDLMGKETGPRQIYLLNLRDRKIQVVPDSDGLFSPRWSPDGRWIAALSLDQKKVMLFDTARRSWTLLAETSAADPVWSRDSKALYIHAYLSDKQPIVRLSVPAGERQLIADLSNVRSKEAENYFFSGLTPDNKPLILPRVGTSNLYRLNLGP